MVAYRNVTFWCGASGGAHCEATVIRARLLGMLIDLGDDEKHTPDKMTAFYEAEGGEIIVYEVESFETDGRMIARWRCVATLEEVQRNSVYRAYLERLEIV